MSKHKRIFKTLNFAWQLVCLYKLGKVFFVDFDGDLEYFEVTRISRLVLEVGPSGVLGSSNLNLDLKGISDQSLRTNVLAPSEKHSN